MGHRAQAAPSLIGATHVDHLTDLLGLLSGQPSAQVERSASPLLPLTERGVSDIQEHPSSFACQRGRGEAESSGRYRGVPHGSAVVLLLSFIAAVDREDVG
jgi:hypothetical protein